MRLEDYDTGERYQARVLSNIRITADNSFEEVRELILEVDKADFHYKIGQSIGVIVSGPFNTTTANSGHALELSHAHHFRLYTVADIPQIKDNGKPEIKICVKRCSYIDEYSGEEYPGIASNFLCDLAPDQTIEINGPFGLPFEIPEEKDASIIMIGMGTGIAPFRAFIKHLYDNIGDWKGKVRLFHGACSGLELLYMNDEKNDFAKYYDQKTFEAFKALSPRPHWRDPIALGDVLLDRAEEVLEILQSDNGHIYVAGQEEVLETLEKVLSDMMGSKENWKGLKEELQDSNRWQELIF